MRFSVVFVLELVTLGFSRLMKLVIMHVEIGPMSIYEAKN